ncbi:MAG: hypothetical protein LBP23_03145 [Treponema sp.]|jgi:hypothetical protein|nr:hypothetical protein [Treponema sp.]
MFQKLLLIGLLVLPAGIVLAEGQQDNVLNQVENAEGFTESVDINERKPGKYNFYIESDDKGGNSTVSGPYNIYLDPESDLPVARITNPAAGMRVPGNLNIVGTCLDDDAVDHVELVFNDDPETTVIPEGKEFWSYYYETAAFPDGLYSITVYGVDINGLRGHPYRVLWNLDRRNPEMTVESPGLGSLVNKKISVRGTVRDGNGVASLSWSREGEEEFTPLRLKADRTGVSAVFEFSLDTRTFEDGPAIIRFKVRDRQGSEGLYTHLVFADNTGPEVTINWPPEGPPVNGIFQAAGSAKDTVGLKSLSWKLGNFRGDMELVVGNPWWIQEFDLRDEKARSLELEIRAEDLSGNITVARRKLAVDQEGDLPRIILKSPVTEKKAGEIFVSGYELALSGTVEDDDGVEAIGWSLNGGEPEFLPCTGNFSFSLRELPPGTHSLSLRARDICGVLGKPVELRNIVIAGPGPRTEIESLLIGPEKRGQGTREAWRSGMTAPQGRSLAITLRIRTGGAIREIRPTIGGIALPPVRPRAKAAADMTQELVLPAEAGSGLVPIFVEVMDIYGRSDNLEEYLRVGEEAVGDGNIAWVNPRYLEDGSILLAPGEALVGLSYGAPLVSAAASDAGLDCEVDEYGRLVLDSAAEGARGPVSFTLTDTAGRTWRTQGFRFLFDSSAPRLDWIGESPQGTWVRDQVELGFTMSDANGLSGPEYSLDLGQTWTAFPDAGVSGRTGEVRGSIGLSPLEDGLVEIIIRAGDEAGKTSRLFCRVFKDTQAPEARLVVPLPGSPVNGTMRIGLSVEERGSLAAVEYLAAGSSGLEPAVLEPARFLNLLMGTAELPLDERMSLRFRDAAGNTGVFDDWAFVIDQEMDLPVVLVNLPREDEVLITDFTVSGIMYDDDQTARVWYSVDGGQETPLESVNAYAIPLSIKELGDNEHSISIAAEDIYGVRGNPVRRNFRISTEEPRAGVLRPGFEEISTGTFTISGSASDANRIERVQISLDNGNSYNNAAGAESWSYTFNSKIVQDGTHVVFIRVWDQYGISGFYSSLVNIDNTAPEVSLEFPRDGVTTVGPVAISGQASDRVGLEKITLYVHSVDGNPLPRGVWDIDLEPGALLKHDLDLSSLSDGLYNIDIRALDRAKNITHVSRNVRLVRDSVRNFVDCLYPLEGEYVRGSFNLYGYTGGIDRAVSVTVSINGQDGETVPVTETGFFRFALTGDMMTEGENTIRVRGDFGGAGTVVSGDRTIEYKKDGPWVSIDSLIMGDFAYERPWLAGRAAYDLTEEEQAALGDRKADPDLRRGAAAKKLKSVDLSFDNGKTFMYAREGRNKEQDWAYRLETEDMPEGVYYLIVRATMENGETAVSRTLIQIDQSPPIIRLIVPQAGGRYNQSLEYSALASDNVALRETRYALRKGDKAAYEVPGFIQGLYFDFHFLGASLYDLGLGLSFFDDNVKLQIAYGQLTQGQFESFGTGSIRYGGDVLGLKLLANVYALPFRSLLGPDWAWLSASAAFGANFSLFSVTQSGSPTWLSALLGQIEFPRVSIPRRKFLRTFALYTELQLWFVPTDVNAQELGLETIVPHVTLGLRANVF